MLPEQQQRILGYFIEEAKDHLNTIEQGLLALQNTIDDTEMLREVYRAAHSIKGGAGMLGLHSIQKTAHLLEDCFKLLEGSPVRVDRKLEELFLRVFDTLQSLVDHLQGPFGLSEDVATSLMATAEPVFGELKQYLDRLVEKPTPPKVETPAADLQVVFKQEVLEQLRQMLQLFKPPHWPNSQSQLQECCSKLRQLGDRFNLSAWCNLIEMTNNAIANPANSSQTLAPVVIKDIKQAQELVLARRETEIAPSEQLIALQPPVPLTESSEDLDFEALLGITEDSDENTDWFGSEGSDDTSTEEEPLFPFDLSEAPKAAFSLALEQPNGTERIPQIQPTDPSGPEVGVAELSKLADLFEEGLDVDKSWQAEEILSGTEGEATPDLFNNFGNDATDEFADLFDDDASEPAANLLTTEEDDTVTLFGQSFLDQENDRPTETYSFEATDTGEDLIDLFPDEVSDSTTTLSQEDEDSQLFGDIFFAEDDDFNLETAPQGAREGGSYPVTQASGSPVTPSSSEADNLTELFSELDEEDLGWEELSQTEDLQFAEMEFSVEDEPIQPEIYPPEAEKIESDIEAIADNDSNWLEDLDGDTTSATPEPTPVAVDEEMSLWGEGLDLLDLDDNADLSWAQDSVAKVEFSASELQAKDQPIELTEAIPSMASGSTGDAEFNEFADLLGDFSTESDMNFTENWESLALGSLPSKSEVTSTGEESFVAELQDLDLSWAEETLSDREAPTQPPELTDDFDVSSLFAEEVTEAEVSEMLNFTEATSSRSASAASTPDESFEDFFSLDLGKEAEFFDGEELPVSDLNFQMEDSQSEIPPLPSETSVNPALDENWFTSSSEPDFEAQNVAFADLDLGLEAEAENTDFNSVADSQTDLFGEELLTSSDAETFWEMGEDSTGSMTLEDWGELAPTPNFLTQPETDLDREEFDWNAGGEEPAVTEESNELEALFEETEEASAEFEAALEEQPAAETENSLDFESFDLLFGEEIPETSAVDQGFSLTEISDTALTAGETETDSQTNWLDSTDDDSLAWLSDITAESEPEPLFSEESSAETLLNAAPELDSTSSTTSLEEVDDFAELESLLGEAKPEPSLSSQAETTVVDDFTALEAMLDEGGAKPSVSPLVSTPSVIASTSQPSPVVSPSSVKNVDDEFAELEGMLKEAGKLGGPSAKSTSGATSSTKPRATRTFEQSMKVPVKQLDNLTNLVGELVVNRNTLEQDQERLRQCLDTLLHQVQHLSEVGAKMQDLYERSLLEASLLVSRRSYYSTSSSYGQSSQERHSTGVDFDPTELDRFTKFHEHAQEMIELIVRVRESTSDIEFIVDETELVSRQFRQVSTQLQEGLNRSRMVPFAEIERVSPLVRYVRDKAAELGKQAELQIEGRDTLIDKLILEHLSDPLKHLINNAIAHGIEKSDVRQAIGKSPVGRITLKAFHQGPQTVISFSDDGAGINVEQVKAKAVEKRLMTSAQAQSLSRQDIYELLYHSGFSTKDKKDLISGAGVGMDVVRTNVSEIRGTITTDSNQGKGTTFTIRLPLTLSICKALCCVSDRARIAFPMDGVEDALDVPKDRIQINAEGEQCIAWRDTVLPFKPLSDLLAYHRQLGRGSVYGASKEEEAIAIVVLRSAGTFIAIQVDQVLGEQEIVIKQLEGPIPKPVGIAGATVLGDGRIMPIGDVLELIDLSMGRLRREPSPWESDRVSTLVEPPTTEPTVLIVDDSITVRELLSMTFNKVGYRVEQARDGQEAWDKLKSGLPCDIVFCDIEMPRMDGLELLSRLHKDPELCNLPIAMLTSRGAEKHRQTAFDLGANGYFTKPYLEEALLDAASRMVKGEKVGY